MADIHCFIMENLLGRDFMNIERIFDLKGSTKGRKVQIKDKEKTGLRVLKDLNYIELCEDFEVE